MVHVTPKQCGKNVRMNFGKINEVLEMPNLIEVQKNSYKWFREKGLREVFRDVSSITDYNGNLVLNFTDYRIDDTPKYTIAECKERDVTYAAPLRVTATLWNKETGEVKESEIFMGDFPLMTESGTFVINGAERVIVSQLVRSPGVYYASEKDKTGKDLFKATVIPNRGAWLEYEMDSNDVVYVRIDKNRKIPITTFIRALGTGTDEEIAEMFDNDERLSQTIIQKDSTKNTEDALIDVYKKLRPGEPPTVESSLTHLNNLFFDAKRYDLCRFGRYKYNKKLGIASRLAGHELTRPVADEATGEILFDAGVTLTFDQAMQIQDAGIKEAYIKAETKEYFVTESGENEIRFIEKEAKVIGNGMVDIAKYVDFDCEALGISEKVRYAVLREILDSASSEDELRTAIRKRADELVPKHIILDDIYATISYFLNLCDGIGNVDDIDHLGNRRIRSVGELLQNQFRIGFTRMERVIRERMNLQAQDNDVLTPQALVNIRPVTSAIKEFFGSSPLSQFMDQNNPLAGVTNKRRLSALGPGGLSRDRASMEVRDVHPSHFGRMCPIESPEGPNIGLIGSLATFGRINPFGFIETPYRKVVNGHVTDEVEYMTADRDAEHVIAQANQELDENGNFVKKQALARVGEEEAVDVPVSSVDYMDVSPRQMVSVGASLIPFLEHDEGHRALMGTNMQRQAVPLIESERPLVGTGAEWRAAVDSGDVILAEKPGVVTYVSADIIRTMNDDGTTSSYKLAKFQRSNQTTCYNQVPLIHDGERVEAGTVLADGPATQKGEMALGKNLLIAFMPWNGYNYEDAVIISQRLVQDDTLSSIHIEEYEIDARETKLGAEEITRDLPNVGEDAVANLDERGIIRIGAEVEAGDILVGKVTPKGETELTPEERLLRAIFGEKSREVRDTSLRVPHGETGTVIAVKEITREDAEEDGDELPNGVNQMIRVYIAQHRKITQGDKLSGRHGNKGVISRILPEEDMPFLADGTPVDIMLNPLGVPSRMNLGQVLELHLGWIAHAGWDISLDPDAEAAWKKYVPQGAEKGAPGTPVATPVFDGVRPETIKGLLSCTLPDRDGNKLVGPDGKATLFDGRTGEPFPKPISVGYMYMLKLHHLVDDKIHARSTGPYSMITQQPLGGKAQFGGQRFGEMEVWALEAYGAAYTLHEMMTTKSDDVDGRVRVYGAIVKGENLPPAGIPESFKVLLKEMQSLSLNVEVLNAEGVAIDMKDEDDDPSTSSDDLGFNIGARPDAAAKEDQVAEEPEFQ